MLHVEFVLYMMVKLNLPELWDYPVNIRYRRSVILKCLLAEMDEEFLPFFVLTIAMAFFSSETAVAPFGLPLGFPDLPFLYDVLVFHP